MQNSCHLSFSQFETFRGREYIFWQLPYYCLLWAKFISWFHWVKFPVVFKWHLHTFAQAESGCSEISGPRSRYSGLILPLSWHFSDPWSCGLTSFVPFFFSLICGVRIYTLIPGLVERHIMRPDRMIAFEVPRTNTSCTLENLFHRNCRRRSGFK